VPPEVRRAEIVTAARTLLVNHGAGVTTRQIAEAAEVAEGTLFRAFEDKQAILDAVVDDVFDPRPTIEALSAVEPSLPLEERLAAAVSVLQRRVTVIWQVMSAVGMQEPPPSHRRSALRDAPETRALAELFDADSGQLRRPSIEAAELLRALTFACSFPAFVADKPRPPQEIVSLLLDGLRSPDSPSTSQKDDRPC
jgi:AcrR family transcriptional regulator